MTNTNPDQLPADDELAVGVCLSGGGHRATAWGAGILAAVIGSGLHRRTVSIGSVSGGSIVNAAVVTLTAPPGGSASGGF